MKNIVLILLITASIFIIMGGLYSLSKIQHRLSDEPLIKKKGDSSLQEIDIMSERFMFSPMMVRLKRGKPVRIVLTTNDTQHGLYEPNLNLNVSAYPGKPGETVIVPEKIGEYTVSCSLYCGVDHDKMKMTFIVDE